MTVREGGAETLGRNWWAILIRGVAAIIFGLWSMFAPAISLVALVLLFGAYTLADGLFAIVTAVRQRRQQDRWGTLLLRGVLGIVAAVLTLFWPAITALSLVFLIAGWAIVTGALEIATAITLRKEISGEWLMVLAGIASVVFGILLVLFPGTGALAVVLWIGAYALAFGVILVALAFRIRAWERGQHPGPHPMPHRA